MNGLGSLAGAQPVGVGSPDAGQSEFDALVGPDGPSPDAAGGADISQTIRQGVVSASVSIGMFLIQDVIEQVNSGLDEGQ